MKKKICSVCFILVMAGNAFSQILVPFVKRYDVTQAGGLVMVGNSMVTCNGGASCTSGQNEVPPGGTSDDNDFSSAYVDIDGDPSTFSSSSADLNLVACSKVTFAGLYWGAYINTGNAKYSQRNKVKIKVPGSGSYSVLTADTLFDLNNGYDYYNCFKDITSIVAAAGNGTFTIADLVAITGGTNQWAGWGIVIAYKNNLLTKKNITVFDGLGNVNNAGSSVTATVNGFYTPPAGVVNFELGEIAFDGDRGLTGDSLLFKGGSTFVSVSDALHTAANIFNSTICNNGVQVLTRNPAYKNTLGFDANIFKPNNAAKNYLPNGATSAQIKVTTGGEQIFLRVITSVVDTYEPDLAMQKTVSDVNGGAVNPGDTLLYTITTTNGGNDTSVATIITDTLPFNSDFVPGSIKINSGPNAGVKTDTTGDDQAELITSAGYQIVIVRLGNGANSSIGGQLPHIGANSSTVVTFKTRITDDCTKLLCNPVISNRANIDYNGFISGLARKGSSNPLLFDSLGCPVEGYTSTSISVPVSCTSPPDTSIGGCLPLVFSSVPGMRPEYAYYNSSWTSVTSATAIGAYHGIRTITGTSCADTINYTVYIPVPSNANAGPNQNLCNVTGTTMAGNSAVTGTGTWTTASGPNSPSFTSVNSPTTTVTGMIAGTYRFRWTISTGCDSTADTLTVVNSPLPIASNAGPNQNLCNMTSTTLAGNTPAIGTGTWTLVSGPNSPTITSLSNPASTVTNMVAGIYIFRWTITSGICSSSASDVQIAIYALPTTSNAGPDQNLCNVTTANLTGNNPLSGTGTWTMVSGPNSPTMTTPASSNTGITGMVAGVYVFRWTITNGICASSSDDVQITIDALPTVSSPGPDQNLCNVTSTTLAGNAPVAGSGTWAMINGPNSPVITVPSSPTSTVTGMINGVYVFRWTITNGVCASSTNDILVTNYALPTVSNAGPDQSLCNVTTTTFAGNSPAVGTGTWSLIGGPNSPTITTPLNPSSTVTGMTAGVYVFRWTITNGVCVGSTDDVQVTIYALPTTSNAGPDQNLCNTTSANLTGNSPVNGSGTWTMVSGPNSPVISTPGSASTNVTGMVAGVYVFRWTISNEVCASSADDVQITIDALSTTSNAGADQSLCNVSSATFAGNTPAVGTGTWTLVSGPNLPSITTPSSPASTVTGMITGIYIFRWTITNGVCASSSDDVQITNYSLPTTSNAGPDQDLCNVTSATFSGNTPAIGAGTWTLVSGPNSPTITTPSSPTSSVTGMVTGVYVFRWTITNGTCAGSTDDVQITIYTLPTISNAGADQSLCNVTSITFAGNAPAIGTGNWMLVSGPNSPTITIPSSPTSAVTGMIAGVYVFRWTITNGVCSTSSDDVQITIYALPTTSNAGPDQGLCNVSSATLAGNVPVTGTGNWSLISGANLPGITTPSSPTSTVTGMITGVYVFRWTIINGVCAGSTDDVQITIYAPPTVSNAGPDQSLCNVTSATLAGNNPVTGVGTWSFVGGPNTPTITTPSAWNSTLTGMIAGVYVFRWTITNGVCSGSTDDIQITIYAPPTTSNAGVDQNLCNVTATSFSANTPAIGAGVWSYVSGPNSPTISSPSNPASTVTGMIAGVYIFRWTISNGVCANSSDDVAITIYDLPTNSAAGPDQDLCNVTSTMLLGNSPATGIGTWTLVSGPNSPVISFPANPGTSVTGMTNGVYIFSWTISNGVCAASSDSVKVTIYNQPTMVDAGPDQNLCNIDSAVMAGNVPGVGTGTWTLISGPNSPVITSPGDPFTSIDGMIIGTYQFGWTISNGVCSTPTDTVEIVIYDVPSVSNAGANLDVCSVTAVTLHGNIPSVGIGNWSFLSGPNIPVINDSTNPNTTVTNMITGIYTFRWTITSGPCSSSTSDVQVTIFNIPAFVDAGPDQNLCNVDSAVMAGNVPGGGTGTWTLISGPNSPVITFPNNATTSVTAMIAGVYRFGWSITNGVCVSQTDTVEVTIYDLPTIADAGSDQNLCNADSVSMAANNAVTGTGSWSMISGPNIPIFANSSSETTSVTGMTDGSYLFVWTISNGVCSSTSDTVQVTIYDMASTADAGPDQNICNADSVTMAANIPVIGNGIWNAISGPNTPLITDALNPATSVSGMIPGSYIFTWAISNGVCAPSVDSIVVTIYSLPTVASAGADQNLCNLSSTTFEGNSPVEGSGIWTFMSGPNTPVIAVPSNPVSPVTGLIAGVYQFNWIISNGVCFSSVDTLQITVFDLPTVADAGTDQNVCSDTSITLSGNTALTGTGVWTLVSGPNAPTIDSVSNATTVVNGLIPGVYVFNWAISNGTCSVSNDSVQVTIYQFPPSIDAGPDQNLCNVNNVTLSGNFPVVGSGTWTLLSGPNTPLIISPSSPVTNVSGMMPGSYLFAWSIINGVCNVYSDTVMITIYALPTSADAGADQSLCDVSGTTLSGNVPIYGSGLWTLISGPNTPVITSPGNASTTVNGLIPGVYLYSWTISNGVCASTTDTVRITIYDSPLSVDAGPDQILCHVDSVSMAGNTPSAGTGTWILIGGPNTPGILFPNSPVTTITGLTAGHYLFGWTINNGVCSTPTDTVSVTVFDRPAIADAGTDQDLCNATVSALTGNIPATGSGTWSQVSGPNLAAIASPASSATAVSGLVPGTYLFAWTISNGVCPASADTVQITIFGLPNFPDAGPDQNLCNVNTVTMAGNTPGVGTGNWSLVSGPNVPIIVNPSDTATSIAGLIAGTYIFRWTISNTSCTPTFDDVQIVIYDLPTISDAGMDQNLCNLTSTSLAGNTPVAGLGNWTLTGGPNIPVITASGNQNTTVTGMIAGTYQFTWTISDGVCASSTDSVQVTIYDLPAIADADTDQYLCSTSIVTLYGNNPATGTGNWSLVSGPNTPVIFSPGSPVTIVSNIISGVYQFQWTTTNGVCASSADTVQVTIYDPPTLADAGTAQSLCNVTSIFLSGNVPVNGVGMWSVTSGPNTPGITYPDSSQTSVTGMIPGVYIFRWTISNGMCSAVSDDVRITIYDLPIATNAGPDQNLCDSTSVFLDGNTPVNGTGTWSFMSGPNTPIITYPGNENSSVTGLLQGSYVFRWTISNGSCSQFDDVQIIVNASPLVAVNNHLVTSCEGQQQVTLVASGANSYSWSPPDYLDNAGIYNPTATINQTIMYVVTGTDLNGCIASDSVLVEICDTLIIPDGFSPDGDGVNDNFVIVGIENYPDNVLHIFNRWGNLLYEKQHYDNSWDGIPSSGKLVVGNGKVPSGTYFYVLELGDHQRIRRGYLIIKY